MSGGPGPFQVSVEIAPLPRAYGKTICSGVPAAGKCRAELREGFALHRAARTEGIIDGDDGKLQDEEQPIRRKKGK